MYFIEDISQKIGSHISTSLKLDKDQQDIITYGTIGLIQVTWSVVCIAIFAAMFNVLMEALIISSMAALLRKYSGGVHATTPNRCIIASVLIIISFASIVHNINLKFNLVFILFLFISFLYSYYVIKKLAPVDSKAKPINSLKMKNRLKKYSIIVFFSLCIVISILLIFYIKFKINILFIISKCILAGILWQVFTLTPTAHKIFKNVKYVLDNLIYHDNK